MLPSKTNTQELNWIERGEKPSAFFFNLEKRNYNRKSIKKLEGAEGTTLTNEDEIFYKQLYNFRLDKNDFVQFVCTKSKNS